MAQIAVDAFVHVNVVARRTSGTVFLSRSGLIASAGQIASQLACDAPFFAIWITAQRKRKSDDGLVEKCLLRDAVKLLAVVSIVYCE